MKLRLNESIDQIIMLYELHYEIQDVNKLMKCNFESWTALFEFLYPLHHQDTVNELLEVKIHHHLRKVVQKAMSNFAKTITYPLILVGISFIMIHIFEGFMLPQMKSIALDFGIQDTTLERISIMFNLLKWCTWLILALIAMLILVYKRLRVWIWIVVMRYVYIIKVQITYLFVLNVSFMATLGLTWNEIVDIVGECTMLWNHKWMSTLVRNKLDDGIMIHKAFDSDIFDDVLSRILFQCDMGKRFEDALEDYLEITKNRINILKKRFDGAIKSIAYVYVGIVIVGYYSAIMVPIRLMEVL